MARRKTTGVWVPLGGKSRRYQHRRTGQTISRRQYDNLRAKRSGFDSVGEKDRVLARVRNSGWNKSFVKMGRRPSWTELQAIEEVRIRRAAMKKKYPDLSRSERDAMDSELIAPEGPLATLLDHLGIRPFNGGQVGIDS